MSPNPADMQAAQKGPKACTTCAKAKARCILGANGDKCERCQRLNKECFSRPPAPPRIKKRPKRSRVAELEKRLNELSSQVGNGIGRLPTPDEATSSDQQPSKPLKGGDVQSGMAEIVNVGQWFPTSTASPTAAPNDKPSSPAGWEAAAFQQIDSLWPQPEDARSLLGEFHDLWECRYPFVVVPPTMSSENLRDKRPFLWKAIMMTGAFFDSARQVRLGEELLTDITRAAMVEGVKTLDLLQGLQLLIGWFHYAIKSTQLTNLLFLARSMCVNLSSVGSEPLPADGKYSPLDPLRAYAGAYYLNTIVFTTNKKVDVFMTTSHLEMCCKALETANEYESDTLLVKLVRIQQLAQSISLTMAFDLSQPAMQLPISVVVQTFQEQINTFRDSLPGNLKTDPNLHGHLCIAEVLVTEIALSEQHCNPQQMPVETRLELLWSCVRALRAFFRARYMNRDIDKPQYLNLTASDIAYSIITSIKLLNFRLPNWDPKQITAELTITHTLCWQINDLALIIDRRKSPPTVAGKVAPIAEDPFQRFLRLLHNAREIISLQCQSDGTDSNISLLAGELDESAWLDIVNETAWNMNDEIMSG